MINLLIMRLLYFSFWSIGISIVFVKNIEFGIGYLITIICIAGIVCLSLEITRKEKELKTKPKFRMFIWDG